MANQVIVTNTGNVQVALTPPPNVQVQISRAAIGTVSNVPTANFANYAGNVTVAAQPNITSVGTLTGLSVNGNASITNLNVTGNLSVGNLVANTANYANYAGEAFDVAVANVTGLGNIATINLDGNVSNVLAGNGSFVPLPTVSANANYANFAGTAFNVSGSNVTGVVANATYAVSAGTANSATVASSANSVAGANVTGTVANATYADNAGNATVASSANSVAVANVVGIGNIAITNYDGNGSNILHGNGFWGPEIGPQSVANANYANFAGTAYSVSGSNVVGDVNGANHANVADVANSVAVGNVVGIGNIATINLDGNGANVLHGNGVFAPEASDGNANYANFSGTLINGTSNITIPSANGNVQISVNGNANIGTFDSAGTGALTINPLISQNNGLRITSVGRGGTGNGASRLTWIKSRGTLTTPLSVEPTDYVAEILGIGHNGTATQTNSLAFIRAQVDSSYTANGANIPLGWQIVVNDTNGGVNNQTKTHQFYSNGNVSFANSVFVTSNLSATGNVTGSYIIGNGSSLTDLTGANVTGQVAYAAVANSVAVANVVGIGNIATINLDGNSSNVLLGNGIFSGVPSQSIISNGTSNVSIPVANGNVNISTNGNANIAQFDTSGALFTYPTTSSINALRVTSFGNPIANDVSRIASSRARGNITTPLSVQPNDATMRFLTFAHNGTAYQTNSTASIRAQVDSSYTANGANIPLGWNIQVNDTNGGVNNQTRTHQFYANGNVSLNRALITGDTLTVQGTNQSAIYGDLLVGTGNGIITTKQLNLSNSGTNGARLFLTGNGAPSSGFQMSQAPFVATLDNVDPTTGISPFFFNTYDASNNYIPPQRFFRSRGTLASPAAVVANDTIASQSFAVYADSGNTYLDVVDVFVNVISNDGVGNVAGQYIIQAGAGSAGIANSSMYVNVPTTTFTGSIRTANTLVINIDNNTTQGLLQQVYNNANIQTGQWTSWRYRGTQSSPLPVQAGDEVSKFSSVVYADSGNTYVPVFQQITSVLSNDLAGNVSGTYQVVGQGANSITQFFAKEHQFGNIALNTNSTIYGNGDASFKNVSASNVSVNTNGFMKLASYTAAALTAITGQIGWMAAVSDSAAGSNPNGMIAFWDTTNNRWSYVHDNSAV